MHICVHFCLCVCVCVCVHVCACVCMCVHWVRTMMQPSHCKCIFILREKVKLMFENLWKKYLRKKDTLKKLQQSGTSRQSVKKAENDLNEYKFFFWINEFTLYRSTISNTLMEGSSPCNTSFPVASSSMQFNEDIMQSPYSTDYPKISMMILRRKLLILFPHLCLNLQNKNFPPKRGMGQFIPTLCL